MTKLLIVLDTTGFIAKYHLHLDTRKTEVYTTPSVVREVKDYESREALDLSLSIGRVKVVEPDRRVLETVLMKAREIGEYTSLSKTDLEVAALAYQLHERGRVVVITDDYALQNLLLHMGIPFKPLRTTGIKKPLKYSVMCPICRYVSPDSSEETCPVCGARLVKKKTRPS